jgi:hypothetical protein
MATFYCGCENQFGSFEEFEAHARDDHNLDTDMSEMPPSNWEMKFFGHYQCQCGNAFSSSAVTGKVKRQRGRFSVIKVYPMMCRRCRKAARLENKDSLIEKAKYYSLRNLHPELKSKGGSSDKKLQGHIPELCGKCKSLGRLCLEEEKDLILSFGKMNF